MSTVNGLLSIASFFNSAGGIILAVLILLAMVTIHEFGHYLAGKLLGFKINEFSVGFGPAILKRRNKKTDELFALRAIPLGGYCAFDGEDETDDDVRSEESDDAPKTKKFNDHAPWKRIVVLVAGATMNYLLALVLLITMFSCCGRPLYKVMARPEVKNEAGEITQEALGEGEFYLSGLAVGDIVESVDGKTIYLISDFLDVLDGKKAGETVTVSLFRENELGKREKRTEIVTLQSDVEYKSMTETMKILDAFGIWGLYGTPVKQGFAAVPRAFGYSVKTGGVVLRSFGELITGKLGIDNVGGPLTTIEVAAEEASGGLYRFLNIAAFIGVNLAVFNLLPVPALDGSKIVFCLIEWIRKKPINRKAEAAIHFIGIVALFGFAILVDILHFLH